MNHVIFMTMVFIEFYCIYIYTHTHFFNVYTKNSIITQQSNRVDTCWHHPVPQLLHGIGDAGSPLVVCLLSMVLILEPCCVHGTLQHLSVILSHSNQAMMDLLGFAQALPNLTMLGCWNLLTLAFHVTAANNQCSSWSMTSVKKWRVEGPNVRNEICHTASTVQSPTFEQVKEHQWFRQ